MAADPSPTARAATMPMGRPVPSAIPATAPTPTTQRPDVPERPRHVRGGHHDHRGGQRQPHRQVDGRRPGRRQRLDAVRPVGPGEPSGDQREAERQGAGEHLVEQKALAPARQQRQGQQHQRPDDQQVVGEFPEPAEQPGEALDQVVDQGIDRGRPGRREGHHHDGEHGQGEQHHVTRAPGAWGIAGRGEQADAAAPPVRVAPSGVLGRLRRSSLRSLGLRLRPPRQLDAPVLIPLPCPWRLRQSIPEVQRAPEPSALSCGRRGDT